MIDPALILPYVAACLLFSIVPGPSVTVVIANSLRAALERVSSRSSAPSFRCFPWW